MPRQGSGSHWRFGHQKLVRTTSAATATSMRTALIMTAPPADRAPAHTHTALGLSTPAGFGSPAGIGGARNLWESTAPVETVCLGLRRGVTQSEQGTDGDARRARESLGGHLSPGGDVQQLAACWALTHEKSLRAEARETKRNTCPPGCATRKRLPIQVGRPASAQHSGTPYPPRLVLVPRRGGLKHRRQCLVRVTRRLHRCAVRFFRPERGAHRPGSPDRNCPGITPNEARPRLLVCPRPQ